MKPSKHKNCSNFKNYLQTKLTKWLTDCYIDIKLNDGYKAKNFIVVDIGQQKLNDLNMISMLIFSSQKVNVFFARFFLPFRIIEVEVLWILLNKRIIKICSKQKSGPPSYI